MSKELARVQAEAQGAWERANESREAAAHAEQERKYAEEEMKRLRVDMHGLEARAAMMRGRLDDIDAAKVLLHEQGMRNAAATIIASMWRGKADRKLARRELEIRSATLMQSAWRRYTARAELRARMRMMQRDRTVTRLAMAAGMLEAGRTWVLKLQEEMAEESQANQVAELENAKEELQGPEPESESSEESLPEIEDRKATPPLVDEEPVVEESEEEPPYGANHERAAIRIQSRFRGRQARKWKREQDAAAARIQARYRGYRARKNMPEPVEEESEEEEPDITDPEQCIIKQLGRPLAKQAMIEPGDGPGEEGRVTGTSAVDREMDGIAIRLEDLISQAGSRYIEKGKQLNVTLAAAEAVAAGTRSDARTAASENHKKLRGGAEDSQTILKEGNEQTRTKTNEHFDEVLSQVKQVHAVLSTLNIGMAEHNQLMSILDHMEENALGGLKDAKFGHNGLEDQIEKAHRRVCQNEQNLHDELLSAAERMHDEMVEKVELLFKSSTELNDQYRRDMNITLRSQLGLMNVTVDQGRIRGSGLEKDLADTNQALQDTKAALVAMTGKATVLRKSEDTLKKEVGRLSNECVDQAEKEAELVTEAEEMERRLKDLQGALSSSAQSLAVARIRATTATLAESQSALLKGQLGAVLELLRMRREVHQGTMTSLAPATTREMMEYVNYLIRPEIPYPQGLEDLYKAEELRYGADVQSGTMRLKCRVKTVETPDGQRHQLEMAPEHAPEPEEYLPSPLTIEPWATNFIIDQSDDESNRLLAVELPKEEFDPVYYIDGEETDSETYRSRLVGGGTYEAYVVAKSASGSTVVDEEDKRLMPFRFKTDRAFFYIDPLNGNDNNEGTVEERPFQTVLHAVKAAADPKVMKEVRLLIRDQAADTRVLTLPAAVIAVIAEEAMHAPLCDGWERSQDQEGNVFYHNKWLANRAPSYQHPMDFEFRRLCQEVMGLQLAMSEEAKQVRDRAEELPEFPAAVHIVETGSGDEKTTELRPATITKGGSLSQFLAEAALSQFEEKLRAEPYGAAIPEDLKELDEAALDEIGMLRLEKLRFHRVVDTAFPDPPEIIETATPAYTPQQQLEDEPVVEEVFVQRQVTLVGAKGLRKTDLMGKSDPYAVVYLDNKKVGQTDVQPKTLDPVWEAAYPVQIPQKYVDGQLQQQPPTQLRVELYDHDTGSDHDFLGQAEVATQDVSLLIPMQTLTLTGRSGKIGKVQGEMTLALQDPAVVRPTVKRQLVVAGAHGLAASDRQLFGDATSDPYAIVFWNDIKVAQTEVASKTLDPEWESRVMLTIPDRGGTLRIEVYDDDIGGDDFLGQVEHNIGGPECAWDEAMGWYDHPWEGMVLPSTRFRLTPKAGSDDAVQGDMSLRIENPELRTLVIMKAVGLRAADKRTSDPYAVVFWDDIKVGQTSVVKETLDPTWDEEFELAINPDIGQGLLRVEIYDHDVGSKADFLGQIEVPLGGDQYGGPGIVLDRRNFPLQPGPRNPTDRIPGSLMLRVEDPQVSCNFPSVLRTCWQQALNLPCAVQGLLNAETALGRPATPVGILEVTLLEAKDLKRMDRFGKNDPYVVISVSGETRRSSTIDGGGQNPIWGRDGGGEQINFEVSSAKAVELACYDEVRFCPSVRAINFSPTKLKSDLHACRIKTRTI